MWQRYEGLRTRSALCINTCLQKTFVAADASMYASYCKRPVLRDCGLLVRNDGPILNFRLFPSPLDMLLLLEPHKREFEQIMPSLSNSLR